MAHFIEYRVHSLRGLYAQRNHRLALGIAQRCIELVSEPSERLYDTIDATKWLEKWFDENRFMYCVVSGNHTHNVVYVVSGWQRLSKRPDGWPQVGVELEYYHTIMPQSHEEIIRTNVLHELLHDTEAAQVYQFGRTEQPLIAVVGMSGAPRQLFLKRADHFVRTRTGK